MTADKKSIFREIADRLPAEQRPAFWEMAAHLEKLPHDDEILRICQAMGVLTLVAQRIPSELVAEREASQRLYSDLTTRFKTIVENEHRRSDENESLHPQLRGHVLWIDEAGLLSARQMRAIFQLGEKQDCRVILSGDTAQHTSVERGDALRLLEKYAGLIPAELTHIRRQKHEQYRDAVRDLAKGNARQGFEKLDRMGAIKELPDDERYQHLAKDYADTISRRKTALVVSPTHAKGERVTSAIREELKHRRKLGSDERKLTRYINQQWTEAERSNPQSYRPGLIIQFHQNVPGFTRAQKLTVSALASDARVLVQDEHGRQHPLPLEQSSQFQVFEPQTLPVAIGDRIRITQNGFTADGKHRLNNGALYQVTGFTKTGDLKLTNGWIIDKDYGHIAHGYCQTSHVAQSKTVDQAPVAQSATSLGASSAEQFYVSVSRARESITIYTDDKSRLAETIQSSGTRITAHELLRIPTAVPVVDPFESILGEKVAIPSLEKEKQQSKTKKEVKNKPPHSHTIGQRFDRARNAQNGPEYRRGISV
jgi:ATP-dependent exoDNAse (exonuclease V) alpha subunit